MHRFYLSLHATLPAALLLAVLAQWWAPGWLPSLAGRATWTVWLFLFLWVVLSALAGASLRAARLWRGSLCLAAGLLWSAGLVGWLKGPALTGWVSVGMALVGLAFVALARVVGPGRVRADKPPRGAAKGRAGPATVRSEPAFTHRMGQWARVWLCEPRYWSFHLAGVLACESFRLAYVVGSEPARSSGMAGLLIAFWIGLPAATLQSWLPRTALALGLAAGLGYAGLALKSGLPQWHVAAGLCACLVVHAGWRARSSHRQAINAGVLST